MATYSNIFIDQGSDFTATIDLDNVTGGDATITGYSGAGRVRKTYNLSPANASFTIVGSSSNAATFTSADKGIKITLSATSTTSLNAGRYVYDVEIRSGSSVIRVLEGQVEVTPRVTRSTEH